MRRSALFRICYSFWNWTSLQPLERRLDCARKAATPAGRFGCAMATDTLRNQVVMFGGYVAGRFPSEDTWVWNGHMDQPSNGPGAASPARAYAAMAFDAASGVTILFGGSDSSGGAIERYLGLGRESLDTAVPGPSSCRALRPCHGIRYGNSADHPVRRLYRSGREWRNVGLEWDRLDASDVFGCAQSPLRSPYGLRCGRQPDPVVWRNYQWIHAAGRHLDL